jgi:hypothetical protein
VAGSSGAVLECAVLCRNGLLLTCSVSKERQFSRNADKRRGETKYLVRFTKLRLKSRMGCCGVMLMRDRCSVGERTTVMRWSLSLCSFPGWRQLVIGSPDRDKAAHLAAPSREEPSGNPSA